MIVIVAGVIITLLTCIPVLLQLRAHPRGLVVLFFAETWERFSYYGMRGILIFYLTEHFLYDDREAQAQYGAYTSLVWLLPLIGGVVADRWLGARKAIAFGALLLVAGHFAMGIEGRPATQTLTYGGAQYTFAVQGRMEERKACLTVPGSGCFAVGPKDGGLQIKGLGPGAVLPPVLPKGAYRIGLQKRDPITSNILYLALSLIIMGVGFLKANISSIVGQLYGQDDPRRDPGFTLYYYGLNLGAFWAAILCGYLGLKVGWWAGFGLAGVGMAAGYVGFVLGKPRLEGHGEPPDPVKLTRPVLGPLNAEGLIYACGLAGVAVVWVLVRHDRAVGWLLGAGSALVLGYLAWFMVRRCTRVERQRLGLALVLIASSVVFWTLFEQAGSSLNQFAERNTVLPQDGLYTITAPQVQSFNPAFILIFAPVFAALWAWLGQRGKDPDPAFKFGIALLQVGLGFGVLVWGARFAGPDFRVPLIFLTLAYLFHTTGELCLSPVGLSQMTKLSPPAVISTVMAVWFLSTSWAQWIGARVAQMTATETMAGQVLDPAKALAAYVHVFGLIGLWGAGAGVVMIVISPWLKTWAHTGRGR
jgi:POT family proton-dependent oligopeptide transporter